MRFCCACFKSLKHSGKFDAIDLKVGLTQALLTAAAINFYFAASVAVVAGFIAIIWFAAARHIADIVSDRTEDMYGRKLFG
jgi:hypothetical protein